LANGQRLSLPRWRRNAQKKAEQEPRLASLDVANAWENMLMQHYGQHFGDFPSAGNKVVILVLECESLRMNSCFFA